jgi:hypothetical protein
MATVYHIRLATMPAGTAALPVMQDKKTVGEFERQ